MDEAIRDNIYGCKDATLLLQVHDELGMPPLPYPLNRAVYEVPQSVVEGMKKLLREKMESSFSLLVPTPVTMYFFSDWRFWPYRGSASQWGSMQVAYDEDQEPDDDNG